MLTLLKAVYTNVFNKQRLMLCLAKAIWSLRYLISTYCPLRFPSGGASSLPGTLYPSGWIPRDPPYQSPEQFQVQPLELQHSSFAGPLPDFTKNGELYHATRLSGSCPCTQPMQVVSLPLYQQQQALAFLASRDLNSRILRQALHLISITSLSQIWIQGLHHLPFLSGLASLFHRLYDLKY